MNTYKSHSIPVSDCAEVRKSDASRNELALVISELARLTRAIGAMSYEISRLGTQVRRPDLVKYAVKEAAKRLGRSRSGLYGLLKDGEIISIKERGRTYITEEEIQRWERANRV